MKKIFIILICILISGSSVFAQFGINTDGSNPDNSAMLDVKSTTKGVLMPRMTFTERNAIVNPINGLIVFCTNCGPDGSLSIYSNGIWRTFGPGVNSAPTAGTHISTNTSIIWNWNAAPDALGYKWSTSNTYANAVDVGTATSKTETGLTCGNSYTRYLWAYNSFGVSSTVVLTQSTLGIISAPVSGIHVPDLTSIVWNWSSVLGADGFKWNTTNNYSTAIDMGTATSKTETGLTCGTPFTRYVWAYTNSCGVSTPVTLTSSTLPAPNAPTAGTLIPDFTSIIWNWNSVPSATGYKWNTTNEYSTATNMGMGTSKTETGLICGTNYTRYAWAYNSCGNSISVELIQSTSACFVCGTPITINHLASGGVAPVDKTVTYETVDSIPGETPSKCWLGRNLGASNQPTIVSDNTEAASGWYWQFNRKQGYKHDGGSRTPNTTWITTISENNNWLPANDPCTLELGNGWRIPTNSEWANVKAGGNWTDWNGPYNSLLKIHAAGFLKYSDGTLQLRGGPSGQGSYWSGNGFGTTMAYLLVFNNAMCGMNYPNKTTGGSIRCIRN